MMREKLHERGFTLSDERMAKDIGPRLIEFIRDFIASCEMVPGFKRAVGTHYDTAVEILRDAQAE